MKDNNAFVAGAPTSLGTALLKGYIPKIDSELTRRLKKAGLIIVGKTNTPKFGLLPTTEPRRYGPTRNPLGPNFSNLISGLVCEHAVTRSLRDSVALLDATAGPDVGDPCMRSLPTAYPILPAAYAIRPTDNYPMLALMAAFSSLPSLGGI